MWRDNGRGRGRWKRLYPKGDVERRKKRKEERVRGREGVREEKESLVGVRDEV